MKFLVGKGNLPDQVRLDRHHRSERSEETSACGPGRWLWNGRGCGGLDRLGCEEASWVDGGNEGAESSGPGRLGRLHFHGGCLRKCKINGRRVNIEL